MSGQLGTGDFTPSPTPRSVQIAGPLAGAWLSLEHTCAWMPSGSLHCWGENGTSQLGDGATANRPLPYELPLSDVASASSAFRHTCSMSSAGAVHCWGENLDGRVGNGMMVDVTTPVLAQAQNVVEIGTGDRHSCGRHASGFVSCWGDNSEGSLSSAGPLNGTSATPITVSLPGVVRKLAVGNRFNCAALEDDRVFCWGANDLAQLGTGANTPVESGQPLQTNPLCD
jgi:alpha-tubulin suppressor-like RCC1 family protein